ncbi:EAL domain-containing protein [Aquipseudomonas campi]|uniref:EAL domain-containing protein n=1 Tax=Aquipseudomonas campi TaxID=2731681 RepID=A0A6M8FK43_9GAMM|nr:EAL domain-containing protein [Pseudomonas campi]QKE65007.1 EAL domain-containing protein [Pseudomonas campi]
MPFAFRWLKPVLSLLLLTCLMATAHAELPLNQLWSKPDDSALHVRLLEEPQGQWDVREARVRLLSDGSTLTTTPSLGWSASTWWLGMRLSGVPGQRHYLWLDHTYLDDVQLWVFSNDQLQLYRQTGDTLPFAHRDEPLRAFLLPLPTHGTGEMEVILRVRSSSSISLPLKLIPAEQKSQLLASSWLGNGLIVGALLVMALFHLLKFVSVRERSLGYYCASILSVAWYNAAINDLTSLLLWPHWPAMALFELNISGALTLIFSTLFISTSLKLDQRPVRWLRNALLLILVGAQLWVQLSPGQHLPAAVFNQLMLATGLFQLALTLFALHLRRPYAGWFTLFWGAAILLMLLLSLSRSAVIPRTALVDTLHAWLPVISVFLFGVLNGRQLDHVRKALLASQGQAIVNLEQYRALFRNAAEGIFRCNLQGVLLESNPSFLRLLNLDNGPSTQLQGQPMYNLIASNDWQRLRAQLSPEQPTASGEVQLLACGGQVRWVHLSLHEQREQHCIEGIVVDLSERRALEQRLANLAAHDSLTGLINRRELERLLQESLQQHGRHFSHLLFLDLDQFKQVNDLCGHSAGDQLLRQLSSYLLGRLPSTSELARIGGDEFAVLLSGTDTQQALVQAEQLREAVAQFVFSYDGRPFSLHASIGVLELDSGVDDWEMALNWADNASHMAKGQGRNRVHLFNPADGALLEHQRQLQWINRLREAIEQEHFELFYQPVQALQHSESGWHYEVLLRYRDPQSGEWIAPGQFFAAAERYGFLAEIDRWVLRRYCQWLGQNPQHAAHLQQVNLNLSAPSLLDPEFHHLLDELLDTHRLPAGKLCLEITEMVALAELGTSASWIERLRSRGIKVALDDFGSGFASYAYLRHLPLDLLKIDGTFILGIERDPINRAMVSSMVQIARQLGLQTVAEFVENSAGLECLRELGIDFAQGYFIDQPKPLVELADQAVERSTAPVSRA